MRARRKRHARRMVRHMSTPCQTQTILERLPAEAGRTLNKALAAPHVRTAQILDVLAQHGITDARAENVNRHRRRLRGGTYACKCPLPTEATT